MKNIIYLSILCIASYFMTSCIDDESKDFQFNMPNVIIGSDDDINFPVGKEKAYTPTIEWANTDSTNYDFLWTYNGREKLSTEKVLKHTFTDAGTFYLTFQMTDRTNKLTYGQDFKLTVSSEYFLGWLILAEDETDGHSALSFIHMNTRELYPDIYKTLYPHNPLGSKPYRMEAHYTTKTDEILIMQKGGDGLIELDGSNFKKVIRTEEEFIGGTYPYIGFNPIRVAYTHKGPELLLTEQGEIYDRINRKTTSMFQTAFYSTIPFLHMSGKTSFTYFTFSGSTNFQLMFDNANKRWLACHNTSTIPYAIPIFTKGYTDESYPRAFDFCNGMDPNIDLVYAETCNESTNNCYLVQILKDNNTDCYYIQVPTLTFSTSNYRITVTKPEQKEFASGYAIDNKTQYCLLRGTGTSFTANPHLFFSIGKKVYFYRWTNDKIYLYKDFGIGENAPTGDLVSMHTNGNATEMGFAFSDGHFYICNITKNIIDKIARGDINPLTDNQIEIQHYSGLGKIVHSIFKYGKSANYLNAKIAY